MSSLPHIVDSLIAYKYLLLFPIAVVEGPIITIIAGFLVTLGIFDLTTTYIVVVIADIVGDILYYVIGKKGGRRLIDLYGHYFSITEAKLERAEQQYAKHTKKTLIFGKLTHAFGMVILITAGVVKLNFWEYITINTIVTFFKAAALVAIGYYFGQAYERIDHYLDNSVLIGTITLVVGWALYHAIIKFRSRRAKKIQE